MISLLIPIIVKIIDSFAGDDKYFEMSICCLVSILGPVLALVLLKCLGALDDLY